MAGHSNRKIKRAVASYGKKKQRTTAKARHYGASHYRRYEKRQGKPAFIV